MSEAIRPESATARKKSLRDCEGNLARNISTHARNRHSSYTKLSTPGGQYTITLRSSAYGIDAAGTRRRMFRFRIHPPYPPITKKQQYCTCGGGDGIPIAVVNGGCIEARKPVKIVGISEGGGYQRHVHRGFSTCKCCHDFGGCRDTGW